MATVMEKSIVGTMALAIVFLISLVIYTVNSIDDAGGIRAVVIDAGIEVKQMVEEIKEG